MAERVPFSCRIDALPSVHLCICVCSVTLTSTGLSVWTQLYQVIPENQQMAFTCDQWVCSEPFLHALELGTRGALGHVGLHGSGDKFTLWHWPRGELPGLQ